MKCLLGQDTSSISPTLGFNIHTLQYTPKSTKTKEDLHVEESEKKHEGADHRSAQPTFVSPIHHTGTTYTLNFWDIGGQASIRSYWRNYYEQTDALIWVLDSADVRRLQLGLQELKSVLQEERLSGIIVVVVANKQDLAGAMSVDEIRSRVRSEVPEGHALSVVGTSAKTRRDLAWLDILVKQVALKLYRYQ